ncbi:unnamed protein product, partial [Amoebophrya sp. A25]
KHIFNREDATGLCLVSGDDHVDIAASEQKLNGAQQEYVSALRALNLEARNVIRRTNAQIAVYMRDTENAPAGCRDAVVAEVSKMMRRAGKEE